MSQTCGGPVKPSSTQEAKQFAPGAEGMSLPLFDHHRFGDFRQHTLAASTSCVGVGVHRGERVALTLRPAAADTGVVFVRTDVSDRDNRVPALADAVVSAVLSTELANAAGVTVCTVEHLMAALCAAGVDNVLVELDGPELPIMDGSALAFSRLIEQAGLRTQSAPRRFIEVTKTVHVGEGDVTASLSPADGFELDVGIDFTSAAIGAQRWAGDVTPESFARELASARTFGFLAQVEALRARVLCLGGSLDNAVVVDGDVVVNAEGLRFPDEFVRHKALDCVGDLYLLGAPLLGRMTGERVGHALNNKLARALLADRSAWRMRSFEPAMAQAG
ncbi:UDP-3-O-acyl-N-acetylglucosamine deacetylase [soil metagenome]